MNLYIVKLPLVVTVGEPVVVGCGKAVGHETMMTPEPPLPEPEEFPDQQPPPPLPVFTAAALDPRPPDAPDAPPFATPSPP